jgi:hypothetical protein
MAYRAMLAELALPHALRVLNATRPSRSKSQPAGRFFDVRRHGVGAYQIHKGDIEQDFDPFDLANVSEDTAVEAHA